MLDLLLLFYVLVTQIVFFFLHLDQKGVVVALDNRKLGSFEMGDFGGQLVQEVPVMGDDDHGSRKFGQIPFQPEQ